MLNTKTRQPCRSVFGEELKTAPMSKLESSEIEPEQIPGMMGISVTIIIIVIFIFIFIFMF